MVVLRNLAVVGPKYHIGDRKIFENGMTATCQAVTENGIATFLMDQYLPEEQPMYKTKINPGTYEDSYLRKFLIEYFNNEPIFKGEIRDYMVPFEGWDYLRIPYVEELFGPENIDGYIKSKKYNNRWPSMINPINRSCPQFKNKDRLIDGWLANRCDLIPDHFASVYSYGVLGISPCSIRPVYDICGPEKPILNGVRIVFKLKNYL